MGWGHCPSLDECSTVLTFKHVSVSLAARTLEGALLFPNAFSAMLYPLTAMALINKYNSMEQSHFRKAKSRSASQGIPSLLLSQKFHCRVHKSLPPVSILSQMNPSHTVPPISLRSTLIDPEPNESHPHRSPYFFNIHFNIILLSTPKSSLTADTNPLLTLHRGIHSITPKGRKHIQILIRSGLCCPFLYDQSLFQFNSLWQNNN
jgi:hypothetical protein